ncbi:MAG TPA: chemotaxis protein CheW [Pirellulales bacterium]|jgi:purine-binding chemotaxis protein CheW|nr:chemotaxis protein CheW [Pirellulales bacterium]
MKHGIATQRASEQQAARPRSQFGTKMPRTDGTLACHELATDMRSASGRLGGNVVSLQKALIFSLGGQHYGLGLDSILEVLPMPWLARPPATPQVLAGFLNLGGTALPVVRLGGLFGLAEPTFQLYTPLIVARFQQSSFAILVESVQGIASFDPRTSMPFVQHDCAAGLVTLGDKNVVLLAIERLLRAHERQRLSELTAIEQSRSASFEEATS